MRGVSRPQSDASHLTLLLVHKYFDGFTNHHIMVVSANGSGELRANLTGDSNSNPALTLVGVYGKVVEESDDLPETNGGLGRAFGRGLNGSVRSRLGVRNVGLRNRRQHFRRPEIRMRYYVLITAHLGTAGMAEMRCPFTNFHVQLSLHVFKRSVESRLLYPNSVIN